MKILLLSDSHGRTDYIDELFDIIGPVDMIVFCGDMDDDCDYISYVAPQTTAQIGVCGNNDWYSSRPKQTVFNLDGLRFYVTHGHTERVKAGMEGLARAARSADCSIALFGHTHKALDCELNGIRLINPGALSGAHPSYAVLTVENGTLVSVALLEL
ncbi:MAG: metallophosphoesterase [Ruminococcaceae bacterium]|nr:metallophosphoesterase [Oscillospiraceae bacterium]